LRRGKGFLENENVQEGQGKFERELSTDYGRHVLPIRTMPKAIEISALAAGELKKRPTATRVTASRKSQTKREIERQKITSWDDIREHA
jgi:hypothetical protein